MNIFLELLSVGVKTFVAAAVLFLLVRLMGKKQISQLSFFDYIVGISIGSVAAAISVEQNISLFGGIVSMIIWALFPICFSFLSMHNMLARRLLDGTPTVLIQNGKIIEKNLRKSKFTINDLMEELRLKDIFNLDDVNYAILETNGKLSVLKSSSSKTVTISDLNLPVKDTDIYANIIIDGQLMENNLKSIGFDKTWVYQKLQLGHISIKNVLFMNCNKRGDYHIDEKSNEINDMNIFQ